MTEFKKESLNASMTSSCLTPFFFSSSPVLQIDVLQCSYSVLTPQRRHKVMFFYNQTILVSGSL